MNVAVAVSQGAANGGERRGLTTPARLPLEDAMIDAKDRAIIALCDTIDDLRKRIADLEHMLTLQMRGNE
jgi:hypothetical protein